MTAATTDYLWSHEQGELDTRRFPVLKDGAPFTVTGWTVDAKIKTGPGGTVLYTWPTSSIAVSGSNVDLTIPPAVSAAWTFRRGWYRIKVIHPTDATQVHRIVQGRFHVRPD